LKTKRKKRADIHFGWLKSEQMGNGCGFTACPAGVSYFVLYL
jgi:hypothetical protein